MTSLTDMPADIVEAASSIVTDVCVKRGQMIGFREMENEYLEQAVARAILAERQRGIVLTAWEREELLRYSECGEGFPSYGEKERSRWKALSAKLSPPKGV